MVTGWAVDELTGRSNNVRFGDFVPPSARSRLWFERRGARERRHSVGHRRWLRRGVRRACEPDRRPRRWRAWCDGCSGGDRERGENRCHRDLRARGPDLASSHILEGWEAPTCSGPKPSGRPAMTPYRRRRRRCPGRAHPHAPGTTGQPQADPGTGGSELTPPTRPQPDGVLVKGAGPGVALARAARPGCPRLSDRDRRGGEDRGNLCEPDPAAGAAGAGPRRGDPGWLRRISG